MSITSWITLNYCLYHRAFGGAEIVCVYACTLHACVWTERQRLMFCHRDLTLYNRRIWFLSLWKSVSSCLTRAGCHRAGCQEGKTDVESGTARIVWNPTNRSWSPQGQNETYLSSRYHWQWLYGCPTAVGPLSQGTKHTDGPGVSYTRLREEAGSCQHISCFMPTRGGSKTANNVHKLQNDGCLTLPPKYPT